MTEAKTPSWKAEKSPPGAGNGTAGGSAMIFDGLKKKLSRRRVVGGGWWWEK
jgi:hypothetical protein